jgi:hypothetical protein
LPHSMSEAPPYQLSDTGVQLLDANGDGTADLLVTTQRLSGHYPLRVDGLWDKHSFQAYRKAPSFNLKDPEVHLVDLDGDGVTDAIRSSTSLECYFNDAELGSISSRRVQRQSLDLFPNVDFSDPRVKWADMRLLAIDALLAVEWKSARDAWQRVMSQAAMPDKRVPVFIVVDEAHNMMPSEPHLTEDQNALRERFRTIAAEGPKYGLFLILVSQRPDKLDPFVLSECSNRAIMRLGSQSVLDMTTRVLGLEELSPKLLAKVLDFDLGRVLIAGPWSNGDPQLFYAASRRTVEGGKNLSDNWAI